jgi:low affinity Fe/Cu permease
MIILNFPAFVQWSSSSDYASERAKITSVSQDGLFAVIPKIGVEYKYDNETYNESYLFYNFWLYGGFSSFLGKVDLEEGHYSSIMVNKNSPQDILGWSKSDSIWQSWINVILAVIIGICTIILVNNVRRFLPQYVREKFTKQAKRKAKKEIRLEKRKEREIKRRSRKSESKDKKQEI